MAQFFSRIGWYWYFGAIISLLLVFFVVCQVRADARSVPVHAVSSSGEVSRSAEGVRLYGCGVDNKFGSGIIKNSNEFTVRVRRVLQDSRHSSENTQAINKIEAGCELKIDSISNLNGFYVLANGAEIGFFTGECPKE